MSDKSIRETMRDELKKKLAAMTPEEEKAFFADVNSSNEKKAEFLRLFIGEEVDVMEKQR